MARAAAIGAVDFARVDPRDRLWWARLRIILDRVEDEDAAHVLGMRHAATVAVMSRSDLPQRSLDDLHDAHEQLVTRVVRLLAPWVDRSDAGATDAAAARLATQWTTIWGAQDDPATQAKIDATVAALKALDKGRPNHA